MKYDLSKCRRVLEVEGLTQTAVAERAEVSDALVSKFFNGKSIRRDSAKKIVEKGLRLAVETVLLPRRRIA